MRRTRNISLEMCQQKHLGKSVRTLLMDHGVNMLLVAYEQRYCRRHRMTDGDCALRSRLILSDDCFVSRETECPTQHVRIQPGCPGASHCSFNNRPSLLFVPCCIEYIHVVKEAFCFRRRLKNIYNIPHVSRQISTGLLQFRNT